jgi:hypothetical protein
MILNSESRRRRTAVKALGVISILPVPGSPKPALSAALREGWQRHKQGPPGV